MPERVNGLEAVNRARGQLNGLEAVKQCGNAPNEGYGPVGPARRAWEAL